MNSLYKASEDKSVSYLLIEPHLWFDSSFNIFNAYIGIHPNDRSFRIQIVIFLSVQLNNLDLTPLFPHELNINKHIL